jgi:hypothetical protein
VGTALDVHLPGEKLDGLKLRIYVDAAAAAVVSRGYMTASDGDMLAKANPPLPAIQVTRQDASVPQGHAHVRHVSVSQTEPNQYFRSYRRTTQRSRALVPVTVRK